MAENEVWEEKIRIVKIDGTSVRAEGIPSGMPIIYGQTHFPEDVFPKLEEGMFVVFQYTRTPLGDKPEFLRIE